MKFLIKILFLLWSAAVYAEPIQHTEKKTFSFDLSKLSELPRIKPCVIVGSGVAGCVAGYYFTRSKLDGYVIKGPQPGGQLTGAGLVENMPGIPTMSGFEITTNLQNQAQVLGVQFIEDAVVAMDLSQWPFVIQLAQGETLYALTVIIATGSAPRKLGIPGELEYWGAGVSTCAVCDCFVYKDLEVAIVGGGDSAAEQALILAPYAKKITIFVRKDQMRAAPTLQERLKEYDHIEVVYNKEILEVQGNGEVVTSLVIKDTPSQETSTFPCDGLFLAIGHNPNTSLVQPYLDLDESGYIHLATRSQETNIRGVFVAGDVADGHFRQAVTAAGTGGQAGLEALEFLREIGITERTLRRYIKE